MKDILRNIPKAEVLQLGNLVAYADGQVVSKTLVQNDGVGITLFAFAKDEGISTHESKGDAMVVALDGKGRITIDGEDTDFVTDENGKVTLSLGDAGHLIISAKSNDLVLAPPVMIVDIDAAETTAIGDSDATTTTATTTMPEDNVTTTPDAVTTPAAATTSTAGITTTAAPAVGTTTKAPSNANSSGSSKTEAAKTGDSASVTAIALAALLAGGTAVAFRRRKNNG